jgi:hypothetical protein
MVVSNLGKGAADRGRQVSVEKVNESEPDRRRIVNWREPVKTVEVRSPRDQSGGYLLTAQSFRRCKGGTSSTQASMGNAGNLSGDAKGNDKWIEPRGGIPMHCSVEEPLVVVRKVL